MSKVDVILVNDKFNQDLDVLLGELRETRIASNELPAVPDIYKDENDNVDTAGLLTVEALNTGMLIQGYLDNGDLDYTRSEEDVIRDINKATGFRYSVYKEDDKWFIKASSRYRNINYNYTINIKE